MEKGKITRDFPVKVLKLIRFPNLLIIGAVQYLLRHGIIAPILHINGFELQMPAFDFFLLSLSTMLLAGAAYVINDYFDQKTDNLNHPGEVLLGSCFTRRQVMTIHVILNAVAVPIGIWLSWKLRVPILALAYLVVPGILFFYSNSYKRQFLIGNFIVALLISMIPLLVALFEVPLLYKAYHITLREMNANFNHVFYWILGFSVFTFGMTLIYELVKDLRDSRGDQTYAVRSVPVVLGEAPTRALILLLSLALMGLAVFILVRFLPDPLSLAYFILAVFLPFLLFVVYLYRSRLSGDFRKPLLLVKTIMLAGVLYVVVAHYIITQTFHLPFPCL